jgi:integrase/recombinase XerC
MAQATRPASQLGSLDAVDAVAVVLAEGRLSEQSFDRLIELMRRFAAFATLGHGARELADVTKEVAAEFLRSPTRDGMPSTSLMHWRRSAVRLLFRTARKLGLAEGDPTLDRALPPRSGMQLRPVTDDEVAVCRAVTLGSESRLAAAWALSEATARTSELPSLRVGDVDLAKGLVWLHGGAKTSERWGFLNEWGLVQIARRARALGDDPDALLVYTGDGSAVSRQASACMAISVTLARAGLGDEPDVRPASVAAWAGRQVLEATGQIDLVAIRLGMRSLDRTAAFVRYDWTSLTSG